MSWTFGNDPRNSVRDRVRVLIGDTNPAQPLLEDEVIDWLIERERNELLAAAKAAEAIAARFAREADISVGDLSVKYSNLAAQYLELAASLREQFSLEAGTPESVGFPALAREEPRTPLFRIGQFESSGGAG